MNEAPSDTRKNSTEHVLIIGAGPAGCACALELVKNGVRVTIVESSSEIGGMCRSVELWDQQVDLGPHRFFSKSERVNEFFTDFAGENIRTVPRLTRIYFRKKFIHYPLKWLNAMRSLRFGLMLKVLWDYVAIRVRPIREVNSFEDWVINRFGKTLYVCFFKAYSEKLWGIPCTEIDADWASQRIKKLSLFQAIKASLFGNGKNQHQTLLDQFYYPELGTGSVYTNCVQEIKSLGGEVQLGVRVDSLKFKEGVICEALLSDGTTISADHFVSSMPLTHLVRGLGPTEKVLEACNKLKYRNTILVYILVDGTNLFEDNWIYIHAENVQHGRITNFSNWGQHVKPNRTVLCMEYWAFDEEELWNYSDDQIVDLAKHEIEEIGLLADHSIVDSHVIKIPRSYPVYQRGYAEHVNELKEFLAGFSNLKAVGRYGAFKYNNQDHSIFMGMSAADIILNKSEVDLWSINTDSAYQESEET